MPTMRSAFACGSGLSRIASAKLKIAVFAPMPIECEENDERHARSLAKCSKRIAHVVNESVHDADPTAECRLLRDAYRTRGDAQTRRGSRNRSIAGEDSTCARRALRVTVSPRRCRAKLRSDIRRSRSGGGRSGVPDAISARENHRASSELVVLGRDGGGARLRDETQHQLDCGNGHGCEE